MPFWDRLHLRRRKTSELFATSTPTNYTPLSKLKELNDANARNQRTGKIVAVVLAMGCFITYMTTIRRMKQENFADVLVPPELRKKKTDSDSSSI